MAKMIVEEIHEILSDKIFDTIIHRNSKIGEAPSVGQPVILYALSSKGSKNFLNLAHEFIQKNTKKPNNTYFNEKLKDNMLLTAFSTIPKEKAIKFFISNLDSTAKTELLNRIINKVNKVS